MASQKNFSITPTVSITRSKFKRPSQHKTSFKLGDIVPIYLDEVLPGDTRTINVAGLVRMTTPITDIMDNIHLDLYAFFVPNRLLWDKWKDFMGENTTGAGAQTNDYTIPTVSGLSCASGSIGNYMGLPLVTPYGPEFKLDVSALPGRAYCLVYSEWFRDQNIIAPVPVCTDSSSKIINGSTFGYSNSCYVAAKDSDYFTRALPYAQKGNAVTLPLGSKAPIMIEQQSGLAGNQQIWADSEGVVQGYAGGQLTGDLAYANLAGATAATINDLRFAFAYQKLLEKDCLYGTRYWELLKAHFGISAPDASLQRPQYLGGKRIRINIDQVLSHAGASTSTAQQLGSIGGVSVTGFKDNLFTFSSVEHGQLMILAVARHDQSYTQGVNRMWSRKKRYDFYFPVFANLGAQTILEKELYCNGTEANDEKVFGFQEAWAEYRYKPSIVTGVLDPNQASSLPWWTLANHFTSAPTLGKTFIEQDREAISRCLTMGKSGPDFIADFLFDEIAVRPMPMYSIPGLIDHH